jgi:superfamily II DNA helicase RecQ
VLCITLSLTASSLPWLSLVTAGRTGRAGRRGQAITLFTEADLPRIRSIANVVKLSGCEVPDWMLSIKQVRCCVVVSCGMYEVKAVLVGDGDEPHSSILF